MAGSPRTHLTAAAAHLKGEGHHVWADALETVLAPGGWEKLRQDSEAKSLSISIDAELKKELLAAAEEFGVSLNLLADQAYRKVLAGEWVPEKAGQRKMTRKAVLNVSVDASLRDAVRALLPGLTQEHGRRISEGAIVVRWACAELGVDTGAGLSVALVLPAPLRDHFQAARDKGVVLEEVVERRVGELMAHEWELPRQSKAPRGTWDGVSRAKFSVRVSDLVRRDLQALAAEFTESWGKRVSPETVIRLILSDQLGEPAA
ncbi:hypothetical protein [Streptomyces longwoodensis]|uniref:hypothetical protein n=1 Tax=Streptomyces longwoodensis TaxID=68231 RepID=UPI0022529F6D|nr:hypothetical protein [Streptomyces longwoodensis]MCX5000952.1 hypothetical protein [Streptomyces longwoodensis]